MTACHAIDDAPAEDIDPGCDLCRDIARARFDSSRHAPSHVTCSSCGRLISMVYVEAAPFRVSRSTDRRAP